MERKERLQKESQNLTIHARKRRQQRGFSQARIDIVLEFGNRRVRNGAYVYFMDKGARAKAERRMGRASYRRVESELGFYVVKSFKGDIVTVAHRKQRLKW